MQRTDVIPLLAMLYVALLIGVLVGFAVWIDRKMNNKEED